MAAPAAHTVRRVARRGAVPTRRGTNRGNDIFPDKYLKKPAALSKAAAPPYLSDSTRRAGSREARGRGEDSGKSRRDAPGQRGPPPGAICRRRTINRAPQLGSSGPHGAHAMPPRKAPAAPPIGGDKDARACTRKRPPFNCSRGRGGQTPADART